MNHKRRDLNEDLQEKKYRAKLVKSKKNWVIIGMTFLSLAGLGSVMTTKADASAVNNIANTSVKANGNVQLYNKENSKFVVANGRTLANGTAWKTAKAVKAEDGSIMLLVGGNEYANAENMDLSDETSKQALTGVVTTNGNVFTRLYTNPLDGAKEVSNRGLGANTSWKTANRVVVNGESFYQVATNEWVKASDVGLTSETSRSEKNYIKGNPEATDINNNGGSSSHNGGGSSHNGGGTVTPTTKNAKVTTKFVDENGKEIAKSKTQTAKVDTDVTETAKKIDGYTLTSASHQKVTVSKDGNTITFTYKKNAEKPVTPTVKKANVTIKLVDDSGKEIAKAQTVADQEVGKDYTANAENIDGYTLKGEATQTVKVAENGSTITFTYTKDAEKPVTPTVKKANVTIKSVDENGKEIAKDKVVADQEVGKDYTASAENIDGYTLKGEATQTVKVAENGSTITFTYTKDAEKPVTPTVKKANVTIKAVDENGKEIAKDKTVTDQEVGKDYTANAETIDGYTLKGDATQTVQVAENGSTITFTYSKNAVVPKTATVTTKFVDENGKDIATAKTATSEIGKDFTANAETIDGYTVKGEATQTQTVNGDTTITFTYAKNAPVVNVDTSAVASEIVSLVNQYRQEQGLSALNVDSNLSAGSLARATDEAGAVNTSGDINSADHTNSDGSNFNMEAHLQQYGSQTMAENLAVTNGSTASEVAQNAFNQWKASSGHNANMLDKSMTDIGVGVVKLNNGQYVAIQDFGGKVAESTWDASQHNSASIADLGYTAQDIQNDLVFVGQNLNAGTGNYYIGTRVFKTKADWQDWMDNYTDDQAMMDSIWGQGGVGVTTHCALITDTKTGKTIGWVPFQTNMDKPASEYLAEGHAVWYN